MWCWVMWIGTTYDKVQLVFFLYIQILLILTNEWCYIYYIPANTIPMHKWSKSYISMKEDRPTKMLYKVIPCVWSIPGHISSTGVTGRWDCHVHLSSGLLGEHVMIWLVIGSVLKMKGQLNLPSRCHYLTIWVRVSCRRLQSHLPVTKHSLRGRYWLRVLCSE